MHFTKDEIYKVYKVSDIMGLVIYCDDCYAHCVDFLDLDKWEKVLWAFSYDEELFHGNFGSKEEVINEALEYKDSYDQDYFFVGQIDEEVGISIDVDSLLEEINEGVYERVGELADDYLVDVDKEHVRILEDRLNDVLYEWMDEFGYKPNFWTIKNVEKIYIDKYKK